MDKNKKTNKKRKPLRKPVKWPFWLFLMTIFQLVCMLQIYINGTQASNVTLFTGLRRLHCGGMDLFYCVRSVFAPQEL